MENRRKSGSLLFLAVFFSAVFSFCFLAEGRARYPVVFSSDPVFGSAGLFLLEDNGIEHVPDNKSIGSRISDYRILSKSVCLAPVPFEFHLLAGTVAEYGYIPRRHFHKNRETNKQRDGPLFS